MYRHILNISFLFLCLFNTSLHSDQIKDTIDKKESCDISKSDSSDANDCGDPEIHQGKHYSMSFIFPCSLILNAYTFICLIHISYMISYM